MKRTLFIFLLVSQAFLVAQAQDKKWQHQFGFDGINFVRNFVNFSGGSGAIANGPYSLQFKALKVEADDPARRSGFRLGFGGRINNSDQATFSTITNTKNSQFDVRLGMEFQRPVAGRFVMFYGVDFIVSDANTINETTTGSGPFGFTTTTKVTNKSRTYGGGPFWGLQFNINKRFCAGTELSYYFRSSLTNNSTSGTTVNDLRSHNIALNLTLPNVLYFNLIF